jgi:hypothetical protein
MNRLSSAPSTACMSAALAAGPLSEFSFQPASPRPTLIGCQVSTWVGAIFRPVS